MDVRAERFGGAAVVTVRGRLDSATAPVLDGELAAAIAAAPVAIVDMAGLDYVSSAGLRVLLKAAKQAKAGRCRLLLCALHPHVREVFDISGFSSIFAIHPDRVAALDAAGPA